MTSLQSIIVKAKDYYFNQWRGKEKICPAFGEKVYVTRLGWNHIVHHRRRNLVDKIIRLKKLPLAREVLEKSTTYQSLQKRGRYFLYGFQAVKGTTRIKVVVASKGKKGKKVLYSVMFKNINRQKQRKIQRQSRKIIADFRKKHPRRKRKDKKR